MRTRSAAPAPTPDRGLAARAFAIRLVLLVACCLAGAGTATSQITFDQNVLSPLTDFPISVSPADVDDDGDVDMFVAAWDQGYAWHENVNGDGTVWSEHTIALDENMFFTVSADIDGDGDVDAVTGGLSPDAAIWYENDGTGSSWTRHVITTAAITVRAVQVADVDGDLDLDVLAASESTGQVIWYENRFGDGTAWLAREIDVVGIALSVFGADMDDDGDIDILVADSGNDTVLWYENVNGSGLLWDPGVVTVAADGAHSVSAADIDEDGDLDVLSASFHELRVAWHENLDGTGTGWADHAINSSGGAFISVAAADMDADGDLDAVSSSFAAAKGPGSTVQVTWYENASGDGLVWAEYPIISGLGKTRQALPADIDGDCDLDIVSASDTTDQVYWLENDLATGTLCPGPWTDLLGGTSGSAGVPRLLGSGDLTGGSLVTLALSDAPATAPVLLFASVSSSAFPVFGGTLHALPAVFELTLQANPGGALTLLGPWPSGLPPGTKFWFQYLVQDPTSVYGITLSNGVVATTP